MKTLKNKIRFGLIFLFSVILVLSVLGIVFINKLSQKSRGTIIDNYSSVDYVINMLSSLDDVYEYQQMRIAGKDSLANLRYADYINSKARFEKNLQFEQRNITEENEGKFLKILDSSYKEYLNTSQKFIYSRDQKDKTLELLRQKYLSLRNNILDIYKINMDAITDKTNRLQSTADDVIIYMSVVAGFSILIALVFIFTFPSRIVGPIKQLTEKIKSISERNYNQKLYINSKDELGELANAFNIMAERLKTYEAKQIDQILFEQKRLEAVVHSFEDGILLIDENKRVVLVNETILKITGLKEEDILRKNITDIAAINDLVREIYKPVKSGISESNFEIKPVRIIQEGKELFFNVEAEEIITFSESEKKERVIGDLILLRNITKFQERDTAKTNLLATVSHELKTPLSSINLSLKLLDDKRIGELNKEQREVVNSLRQQSLRLSRVINELLDYSQIETGNIKLKFTTEKPDVVLDIGITALMMQVSEKNIELKTSIEESLPEIYIDLEKLVFVFINILNNAIRYSRKDGVIEVDVKKINNDVVFSIKDNGPGISKEDQEKLFQRFTQVGKKSSQGWGLGLAISKEFMQAQNGRIWLESEIEKGTKFCFSVPSLN